MITIDNEKPEALTQRNKECFTRTRRVCLFQRFHRLCLQIQALGEAMLLCKPCKQSKSSPKQMLASLNVEIGTESGSRLLLI